MIYFLVIEGEDTLFLAHGLLLVVAAFVTTTIIAFRQGFHRHNGLILLLIDKCVAAHHTFCIALSQVSSFSYCKLNEWMIHVVHPYFHRENILSL